MLHPRHDSHSRWRLQFKAAESRRLHFEQLECRVMLSTQSVDGPVAVAPTVAVTDNIVPAVATSSPTGLSPSQLRQAYGVNQITFSGGTIVGDGAGMTIAIVDAYDDPNMVDSTAANFSTSDLAEFDAYFGLPNPPSFTKLNQTGGTTLPSADPTKSWEGEEALDVEWAHAMAPDANIILFEATGSSTASVQEANLLTAAQTAAATSGVNVVSMSWGYLEASVETGYDTQYFAQAATSGGVTFFAGAGDNVDAHYPGISQYVVGVGGTTLTTDAEGDYEGETTWTGSGGSVSQYEPQPPYQSGVVSAYSTTMHTLPDVAFDANPTSGVSVYNSYTGGSATPWYQVGGNSLAAPSWAALVAIADQGRAINGLGSLSGYSQTLPMLYSLPASDFHDITSGTNYAGDSAGPGYDLATGLGSPIANLLVPALASMVDPALAINGSSTTFVRDSGNAVAVAPNLSITDTNGATIESATVTIGNLEDGGGESLSAGTFGTNITASYSGGTLTLSGQDSVAHYQQVLDSVEYIDTSASANTTTRQITFTIDDIYGLTSQATQDVNFDVAPQVIGAFVSGSNWSSTYLSLLDSAGLGSSEASGQGFELASGGNQLSTTLPWSNANQIAIAFSEPVNISQTSLTLYNGSNTAFYPSAFSYNSSTYIATWQFATSLAANEYVMNLAADSVSDLDGAQLDGYWNTSVSTFAAGSGNGAPGSDFNFYFNSLPGDANSDGQVNGTDLLFMKLDAGAQVTTSNYRYDLQGSATISSSFILTEKLNAGLSTNQFSTPNQPASSLAQVADASTTATGDQPLTAADTSGSSLGSLATSSSTLVSASLTSLPSGSANTPIAMPAEDTLEASSTALPVSSIVAAPATASASSGDAGMWNPSSEASPLTAVSTTVSLALPITLPSGTDGDSTATSSAAVPARVESDSPGPVTIDSTVLPNPPATRQAAAMPSIGFEFVDAPSGSPASLDAAMATTYSAWSPSDRSVGRAMLPLPGRPAAGSPSKFLPAAHQDRDDSSTETGSMLDLAFDGS